MNTNLTIMDHSSEPDFMLEINTTPLIDVMLVLLIMLIITIPLQLHAVNLELPVESSAFANQPHIVRIDIDADNVMRLDDASPISREALEIKLKQMYTQGDPLLELHINASAKSSYETLAFVLASAQRQGLSKLNIIGVDRFKDL